MCIYIFSFIAGGLGAWGLMKYGDRVGMIDIPNNRSSHTRAIPKGGGIGILIAFLIVSIFLSIPVGFWLPALVMALISLWGGDKHCLSPENRLILHFACSLIFLFFVGDVKLISSIFILLCIPLSVFIVGTSNFYNFMDGIDGIASITGVVGFFLLGFYSYMTGTLEPYGILCIALSFSCLGFLCFNIPDAKVFLGDVGSIMLGFVFACMIIVLSENIIDFMVMTGFLMTFYFDEIFTMVMRMHNKDSLIQPHRKHIYQLLANELSISHWKIALSYGAVQLIIGLSFIYIKPHGLFYLFLLYFIYCFLLLFVSIQICNTVRACNLSSLNRGE